MVWSTLGLLLSVNDQYKHMSPGQLSCDTRNLSYVTRKFVKLSQWWIFIILSLA